MSQYMLNMQESLQDAIHEMQESLACVVQTMHHLQELTQTRVIKGAQKSDNT